MQIHADLDREAIVHAHDLPWVPAPVPGIERRMLERDGDEVARASSIVRYAPGRSFPSHVHGRGEEFLVLEGRFDDEHGQYEAGTYVRNPPGSSHAPSCTLGCTIFVKLRQFAADDDAAVVVRPSDRAWAVRDDGLRRCALHVHGDEQVALLELPAGFTGALPDHGGEGWELLVLHGVLRTDAASFGELSWWRRLRAPTRVHAPDAARVWLKTGHLRATR